MNGYNLDNMATWGHPEGWTDSSFLIDPYTYNYYHSHYTNKVNATDRNADVTAYPGQHTTDVTHQKALDMLKDAAESENPFFMMVAPVAPHVQLGGGGPGPPIPPKYKGVFNNRTVPRTENFNPDAPSGASWIHALHKQTPDQIAGGDKIYNHRLGNLAYIDDMVSYYDAGREFSATFKRSVEECCTMANLEILLFRWRT